MDHTTSSTINGVKSMKYPRIVEAVFNTPWAIMPDKMDAIVEFINIKAAGHDVDVMPEAAMHSTSSSSGSVQVIPVHGVISHRIHMVNNISGAGGTSTEMLGILIDRAVNDPNVKTIVLDIDSPGGSVSGVEEVAEKIYQARQVKPIIGVANALAASAAYWIGSACSSFSITPSGMAGSIGVLTAHTDVSAYEEKEGFKTTMISAGKYKVEGHQFEPLAEDAKESIQSVINEYYEAFVSAVARNRGATVQDVKNGYGEGRALTARDAVKAGLVDKIETIDQVLERVTKRTPSRRMNAEIDLLEIQ